MLKDHEKRKIDDFVFDMIKEDLYTWEIRDEKWKKERIDIAKYLKDSVDECVFNKMTPERKAENESIRQNIFKIVDTSLKTGKFYWEDLSLPNEIEQLKKDKAELELQLKESHPEIKDEAMVSSYGRIYPELYKELQEKHGKAIENKEKERIELADFIKLLVEKKQALEEKLKTESKSYEKWIENQKKGFETVKKSYQNKRLEFSLRKSHPIYVEIPSGLEAQVEANKITIKGLDKAQVTGFVSNKIRPLYPPNIYKGSQDIYYLGEEETIKLRPIGKTVENNNILILWKR
ncbi:MAG: 50S ribosomal protein L6 [Mycoplasmataceae bacterium RC_NB112A]|nr:MAG: 50S ribosomal protein L6 [Mycoplasmataceae bacterium RC_NB112A]